MRNRSLGVAVGVSLALAVPLFACGDKFLLASRGIRSLRGSQAAHPSSILIFSNPGSVVPAADREMRLQSTLTLAGHKAATVDTATALGEALKTGKYDFVLADISDAAVVKERIGSSSPKTRLLPAMSADRKDRKAAEKEYGPVVTLPSNSGRLLASIDDVLETRATSRAR